MKWEKLAFQKGPLNVEDWGGLGSPWIPTGVPIGLDPSKSFDRKRLGAFGEARGDFDWSPLEGEKSGLGVLSWVSAQAGVFWNHKTRPVENDTVYRKGIETTQKLGWAGTVVYVLFCFWSFFIGKEYVLTKFLRLVAGRLQKVYTHRASILYLPTFTIKINQRCR